MGKRLMETLLSGTKYVAKGNSDHEIQKCLLVITIIIKPFSRQNGCFSDDRSSLLQIH